MEAMATEKAKVFAYVSPLLKKDFEALCEVEKRSVSNYVELLIDREIQLAKQDGRLPSSSR